MSGTNIEGIADGHFIEDEGDEIRAGEHAGEYEVSTVEQNGDRLEHRNRLRRVSTVYE